MTATEEDMISTSSFCKRVYTYECRPMDILNKYTHRFEAGRERLRERELPATDMTPDTSEGWELLPSTLLVYISLWWSRWTRYFWITGRIRWQQQGMRVIQS